MWMGKHGFVRAPAHYGMSIEEYQRQRTPGTTRAGRPRGVDANERLVGSCKSNAEARLPLVTKEHILDIGNHVTNQSAGAAILHLCYRGRYGVHTRIAMPRLM